jgi:phosphatidylglycerophosphate synthase
LSPAGELDAIVLATDRRSQVKIAGLTARERAIRVARKAGAVRVCVIDAASDRQALAAWRADRPNPILVIRADQLVHPPLVLPLVAAMPRDGTAIATVPDAPAVDRSVPPSGGAAGRAQAVDDLTAGSYAGAFVASGAAARAAVAALGERDDGEYIASLAGPARVPHGAIARAPIGTPGEIAAAHRLLYQILVKPQDNAITRYLYRPVSFPLTRLLVWTPITPNQISYLVAALVVLGCWVTAHARPSWAVAGTAIVLAASYLDCCDGEVARVKLLSSRFGAWIDTVVDELSSIGYMVAVGWHCHLVFGPRYFGDLGFDPWTIAIAISVVTYVVAIYCIYYNLIVAVGSANSQDYAGKLEVIPGGHPNSVRLRPATVTTSSARELPPALAWIATYAPFIVRRDFISWAALALAVVHWTHVAFVAFVIGGVGTSAIVSIDHVKLRALRRSLTRQGLVLEAP